MSKNNKQNQVKNIIFKGYRMSHEDFMKITHNNTRTKDVKIGEVFNYMCRYSKDYEMSLKG